MNFLLIDDHAMIRAGVTILVAKYYPEANFFEAANEQQACSLVKDQIFDLILMDINMPDSDPVRLIQFCKTHQPGTPMIVLTMNEENSFAGRFFKNGNKGICK